MNLTDYNRIHLIGIGGINVSAIAKLFLSQGKIVSGSDLVASDITADVSGKGARVAIGHAKENLAPDADLVIYTDSAPTDNPERASASERSIPQMSNFQFWGKYARAKKVIAISGTNGKSTTTAMLGLILEAAGFDPTVVAGTRVLQWGSNIRVGKSGWLVIEADEYRAHMLEFEPYIAVITNIAPDHLDFYKDLNDILAHFQKWIEKIPPAGALVLNANDAASQKLRVGSIKTIKFDISVASTPPRTLRGGGRGPLYPDSATGSAMYKGSLATLRPATDGSGKQNSNSEQQEGGRRVEESLHLQVPGQFNMENALAAAAAAQLIGINKDTIISALNNFTGTWRRFEKVGEYNGALVISDYAHHPDGIKATLQAAREKYPNRRLVVLYQPHQHNRTRKLFDEFVQSFDLADELILAEIYDVAGRESKEDQTISSKDLVEAIQKYPSPYKGEGGACPVPRIKCGAGFDTGVRVGVQHLSSDHVSYAPDLQTAEEMVKNKLRPNDVLIVMGAGDVDKVARSITC